MNAKEKISLGAGFLILLLGLLAAWLAPEAIAYESWTYSGGLLALGAFLLVYALAAPFVKYMVNKWKK